MPLAKIHVLEGRYDERRLGNVSKADRRWCRNIAG